MEFKQNFSLQTFNTLAVESFCEYFARVESVNDLQHAITFARRKSLPIHIIGGGSNLILDEQIQGVVIKNAIKGVSKISTSDETELVTFGAGEIWHECVQHCLKEGLFGTENLALIPGTIGAAPIQNIGAYGVELEQIFASLEAIEIETGKILTFDRAACEFAYRDSFFKKDGKGRFVITSVTLKLSKNPLGHCRYPALIERVNQTRKLQMGSTDSVSTNVADNDLAKGQNDRYLPGDIYKAVVALRTEKIPDPKIIPNAGSFFKNPIIERQFYQKLLLEYSDLPSFDIDVNHVKIPAAWLIDEANWKTKCFEGVSVYKNQALVVINPQKAPAKTILKYAAAVQDDIKQKFGIVLEIEPQRLMPC